MSRVAQAPLMRTSADNLNTQYAHVCSHMLTYAAGVESEVRTLADKLNTQYARECSRMLTYAHVCYRSGMWHACRSQRLCVCGHMLTYADGC